VKTEWGAIGEGERERERESRRLIELDRNGNGVDLKWLLVKKDA